MGNCGNLPIKIKSTSKIGMFFSHFGVDCKSIVDSVWLIERLTIHSPSILSYRFHRTNIVWVLHLYAVHGVNPQANVFYERLFRQSQVENSWKFQWMFSIERHNIHVFMKREPNKSFMINYFLLETSSQRLWS